MRKPDMRRRTDRAGQTVEENGFRYTYDADGYAKRAEKISDSPGYVVDGKTYPGEPIKRPGKPEVKA